MKIWKVPRSNVHVRYDRCQRGCGDGITTSIKFYGDNHDVVIYFDGLELYAYSEYTGEVFHQTKATVTPWTRQS